MDIAKENKRCRAILTVLIKEELEKLKGLKSRRKKVALENVKNLIEIRDSL